LKIDVRLEIGSSHETVQVQANASGVETIVATLGSVVSGSQISEAPLDGRNVMDLATLLPGVVPTPDEAGGGGFNIGGGRGDSVTYLLDGGMNNDLLDNSLVANPNPDAVEEFRVLTSNYSAEYGRNGAGIVSVVTKSGTNEYHGVLFEYDRNDDFNANTFFNNQQNLPRNILKRNQFGAEVGGPLSIPKLFNAKNRVFFMTAWQSQRLAGLVTAPEVTVFTPAELTGNFFHSGPNGGPDPRLVSFLQQYPYFQPNPVLAAQAIIDPSRISQVARNYIQAGLIPSTASGQLFPRGPTTSNNDELTNKVDFAVDAKDRISVTLSAFRTSEINPFYVGNPAANGAAYNNMRAEGHYLGTVAYTKTISPTMVNDFRFTAQRLNAQQGVPASKLPSPSELGIAITPDVATGPPRLTFFDSGLTTGFSAQGPTALIDNTFTWNDTLSWQHGKHGFKSGLNYTPFQNNTVYDFYINGNFFFYGQSGAGSYSENDRADFLMGLPDEMYQGPSAPSNIRTHNIGWYFQDEWKVKKNLTLTLGIRYEYSSPKLDLQGRTFTLDIGHQSQVFPNAPPGLLFPGDPGVPRGVNFPDRNDWAPRFGFAWDPTGNGKMSVRGGFGVFYDILKGEDNLQFNGVPPFSAGADLYFNALSGNPTSAPANMSDPYGTAGLVNPFPSRPPNHNLNFADSGFLPIGGGVELFVNPNLRTPYIYQYNLSVQREIWKDTTLEVSYIGSDSHKLTALKDANPFPLGSDTRLFDSQPGVIQYAAANDVKYPVYSFSPEFDNVAQANYNALAVGFQKRYGDTRFGSFQYQFSWTYGHSIDNASGFRSTNSQVPAWDWDRFRADSDFDIRHYIAFSGSWELPFNKMWDNGPKRLTRGWTLYPIVTYRTGGPMTIFAGLPTRTSQPGPSGAGDQYLILANQVNTVIYFDPHQTQTLSNPNIGGTASGNYFFNPDAFNADFSGLAPGQFTYGTSGRNEYRGPNLVNCNLTLAKNTFLYNERVKLEIRADFFNVLNHAEFSTPNLNIGSPQFGQISSTGNPRIIQFAGRFTF
jgi:outer membrane receptor protein involved in Fe transport